MELSFGGKGSKKKGNVNMISLRKRPNQLVGGRHLHLPPLAALWGDGARLNKAKSEDVDEGHSSH